MNTKLFLLALIVLLAGCTGSTALPAQPPANFSVRYEWREGSVPPPYHYEYTIEFQGGKGQLFFWPDYPTDQVPTWTEQFAVDEATTARIYQLMMQQGVWARQWRQQDPMPVGGATDWLAATAQNATVKIPIALVDDDAEAIEPVYNAIRALVPQATWDALRARQEAYHATNTPQP